MMSKPPVGEKLTGRPFLHPVVGIPAFNEERTIAKVVIGAKKYVDDVVVCDDGSSDMTAVIAEKLGAKVIRLERNMGKGEALRSLFAEVRRSGADALVTLDGDGQHFPSDIPKVLDGLTDADVVVGSRFMEDEDEIPGHRKVVNKVLNKFTVEGVTDTQSGFRGYGKRALGILAPSEMGMGVDSEILVQAKGAGLSIIEVPVGVTYNEEKTSTHNPFFHTLDVLGSVIKLVSIRHPLLFYGLPGGVIIVVGIYYGLLTAIQITETQVLSSPVLAHGLAAIALLMIGLLFFFTGVILFTLTSVVRQKTA